LEVAKDAKLYKTTNGEFIASVEVDGHSDSFIIGGNQFRMWLVGEFDRRYGAVPNREITKQAIETLQSRAQRTGTTIKLNVRRAKHGDCEYLDLCNDQRQVVKVYKNEQGLWDWRIIDNPPVVFIRFNGMEALPTPLRGVVIRETMGILRKLINVEGDEDFAIAVSMALEITRVREAYPACFIHSGAGGGKSQAARIIRNLVDKNYGDIRGTPRDKRLLFTSGKRSACLVMDNVSQGDIRDELSDNICQVLTGAAFAQNVFYETDEEAITRLALPVIIASIDNPITRGDLADRTITLRMGKTPNPRKEPEELNAEFEKYHAQILGALLDIKAYGLNNPVDDPLSSNIRMISFARSSIACEPAYTEPGTFMRGYLRSMEEGAEDLLLGDIVATALLKYISKRPDRYYKGKCKELYMALTNNVNKGGIHDILPKYWPTNAQALSRRINRLEPTLAKVGIEIKSKRSDGQNYEIRVPENVAKRLV
jgi:hypothetical protein